MRTLIGVILYVGWILFIWTWYGRRGTWSGLAGIVTLIALARFQAPAGAVITGFQLAYVVVYWLPWFWNDPPTGYVFRSASDALVWPWDARRAYWEAYRSAPSGTWGVDVWWVLGATETVQRLSEMPLPFLLNEEAVLITARAVGRRGVVLLGPNEHVGPRWGRRRRRRRRAPSGASIAARPGLVM